QSAPPASSAPSSPEPSRSARRSGGGAVGAVARFPHERGEPRPQPLDLLAVLPERRLVRTPLLEQGADENEALQVQQQVVDLPEASLVGGDVDHAASSATSPSTSALSDVDACDSVRIAAATAPTAATAAST